MVRSFGKRYRTLLSPGSACAALAVVFGFAVYYIGVLGSFRRYLSANTPVSLVETLGLALLPISGYIALRFPLILPFSLYIMFIPFDTLSSLGNASTYGNAGTVTKLLGIASAAPICLHLLRRGNFMSPPRALAGWLALLALMTASLSWSLDQSSSTAYLKTYASLIALYALLSIVRVRKIELDTILAAVVFSGVFSAGYVAYLFRNSLDVIEAGAGASRVIISAGGSSIDPNEMAFGFILPFSIALYWIFNSRYRWLRALMLPTVATFLLGFAACGSRGGFSALATVFLYLIVRSRHRIWLGALMVISVASALGANPGLPARFMAAQQDGAAGRGDIWRIGLYAFRHHWLYGAGIGNFSDAFDREYIHVFVRYVTGWHWVAHSVPLQIATELGVVGLGVYGVAFVLQLTSLREYCTGPPLFELRLALEAACIGIFIAGLTTSTLNAKFVWLAFSLMSLMRSYQITMTPFSTSVQVHRISYQTPQATPVHSTASDP